MESKRQKGKISKAEWENIAGRHSSGESLASIARDYHCTAPAIRYIVSRKFVASNAAASAPAEISSVRARMSESSTPPEEDSMRLRGLSNGAGKSFIDDGLRERVTSDIASFLVALDVARTEDGRPRDREPPGGGRPVASRGRANSH